jgi:hypothetical protein
MASAECSSPIELAAQTLALRQMLAESADAVGQAYGVPVRLVANNVDYALRGASTYGFHVNVLLTKVSLQDAVRALTPLLAVMPVLAGAGKVSFAKGASGFELSQRAGHMCTLMSRRTMDARALVTAKDEPLSASGARLHVISFDTTISPWQLILVPAVLALSAKAVESGHDIAERWSLADPVRALQTVSCDPSLRAELPLARGGVTTALDVLDAYREAVEEANEKTGIAAWAPMILSLWKEVLANLRSDPFLECGRLDWVTKLISFTTQLERERLSWREFSRWSFVLASLRRLKGTWSEVDPVSMASSPNARAGIGRSALGVLEHHFAKDDLSWEDLPRVWRAANQLCGLCVQSHVLIPGTYQGGVADRPCPLVSDEMVDHARTSPPTETRAAVRGLAIQKAAAGAVAGWAFVTTDGRRLSMNDAFGRDASWVEEEPSTSKETG